MRTLPLSFVIESTCEIVGVLQLALIQLLHIRKKVKLYCVFFFDRSCVNEARFDFLITTDVNTLVQIVVQMCGFYQSY